MPQVYRRYSEYVQRPPPEPRRRSSLAPQPTDADDSIVLSDLVRTGEASRLRRRGAMRLDHGLGGASRPSLSSIAPPMSNMSSANPIPDTRPIDVVPSTPPWTTVEPLGEDEYTYGGGEWRDWNGEDSRGEGSGGGMQLEDMRRDSAQDDEGEFMLFCGGAQSGPAEACQTSDRPFEPAPFPVCPRADAVPPHGGTPVPRTNGCGALVHARAFPQRPRGVWVGKEEASEVVVGLDAAYFERSVIAKMMKSACGCVREGIGCAVCGNTLGTRYLPCQAASEGFFYRGVVAHGQRPASPPHPSGPRYWDARVRLPALAPSARASPRLYVYTFFADQVSPSRPCGFPASRALDPPSASRPASPAPLSTYYGYRLSSSPRPFSPYPGQPAGPQTPPARLGLDIPEMEPAPGAPDEGAVGELDPDGVVVEVDMAEPSSPDKTGSEGVLWPGR